MVSLPSLLHRLTFLWQARLIDTGAKKLAQMFTKLVAEGSSGAPPGGPVFEFTPFSPRLIDTLNPLVKFLRTLPLPSPHPSNPAAKSILSSLKEAQRGYAEMRGNWCKKCLEVYGRRVVDRAETIDGVAAGRELGTWVKNLLNVVDVRLCVSYSAYEADHAVGGVQTHGTTRTAPR